MRAVCSLLLLIASISLAAAQEPSVEFDGARYVRKKEATPSAAETYVQFGLENEPLTGWTKLVTFHLLPEAEPEPTRAAATMLKFIKDRSRVLGSRLFANAQIKEAMLSVLYTLHNSDVVEFNVYKYAPAGKGLVAAQFSYRVNLGEQDASDVKELRQRAARVMTDFDMAAVKAYFERPR